MTQKQLELAELIQSKADELSRRAEIVAQYADREDTPLEFLIAMMQSSRSAVDFWVDQLEAQVRGKGERR